MNVYCVFTRTGKEEAAAVEINNRIENGQAIVPAKVVKEKRKGIWETRERVLMPGYLFVFSEGELDRTVLHRNSNVIKLLQYDNGTYALTGADLDFAMWFRKNDGLIDVCEVFSEGDEVKIMSGPLMDFTAIVTKFDRHKRKIWVSIDFMGQDTKLTLSVDDITKGDNLAGLPTA